MQRPNPNRNGSASIPRRSPRTMQACVGSDAVDVDCSGYSTTPSPDLRLSARPASGLSWRLRLVGVRRRCSQTLETSDQSCREAPIPESPHQVRMWADSSAADHSEPVVSGPVRLKPEGWRRVQQHSAESAFRSSLPGSTHGSACPPPLTIPLIEVEHNTCRTP